MSKQFWAVVAVIVLIFVGIFVVSSNKTKTNGASSSTSAASQHIVGTSTSGVKFVEYGDFQCPYCQVYAPFVKQAQDEFKDRISFQFRNFPLVNNHPNAFAAARAAEAAGYQGKFWEMHDALYVTSDWQVWTTASDPTPYFNQYAAQLGLDVNKFKADYASSKVNDTINADMAAGTALNVPGTPTFFINGKAVTIKPTLADFEKVLNAAIAAQAKTTKS
jgi:protein-disulfide isomerase